MHVLVCEQSDLSPEPVEGALLKRSADEVGADEQRERDGAEHGGADGEPQPSLQRVHVSRSRSR